MEAKAADQLTVVSSSCKTWSYSDMATQKMMAVTSSKQWIHFLRSDRWPPTSKSLKRKKLVPLFSGAETALALTQTEMKL